MGRIKIEELLFEIPPESKEGLDGMLGVDDVDMFCIGADHFGKAARGQDAQVLPIAFPES